ncbi:MAG: ECF transporter S component [Nitrososphaerota archaeon]|nr:ECF transporter S component [Nitrososphaerota archaeon]MDG7010749.1 ECF transporter S component [Nitrososphaerota archaeon]
MGNAAGGVAGFRVSATVNLAVVIVFSALIALGTFLSIKLPVPLGEITWAPPVYMALSILGGPWTGFTATAIGSFVGESLNVAYLGWPAIYAPGIVWARAPEALIIGWARKKGTKAMVAAMVGATVFETLLFFFPDAFFYTYGLFGYGNSTSWASGFALASTDLLTMLDLAFIPVALVLIRVARPAFRRLGYG